MRKGEEAGENMGETGHTHGRVCKMLTCDGGCMWVHGGVTWRNYFGRHAGRDLQDRRKEDTILTFPKH